MKRLSFWRTPCLYLFSFFIPRVEPMLLTHALRVRLCRVKSSNWHEQSSPVPRVSWSLLRSSSVHYKSTRIFIKKNQAEFPENRESLNKEHFEEATSGEKETKSNKSEDLLSLRWRFPLLRLPSVPWGRKGDADLSSSDKVKNIVRFSHEKDINEIHEFFMEMALEQGKFLLLPILMQKIICSLQWFV